MSFQEAFMQLFRLFTITFIVTSCICLVFVNIIQKDFRLWEHILFAWPTYVYCYAIGASLFCVGVLRINKHLKWDDNWERAERNFDTPYEPSAEEIASEDALQRQDDLEASNIDNYVLKLRPGDYVPNVKDSVGLAAEFDRAVRGIVAEGLATPNQETDSSYLNCDECGTPIYDANKGYVSPWDKCWCVKCTEELKEDDPCCFEDENL